MAKQLNLAVPMLVHAEHGIQEQPALLLSLGLEEIRTLGKRIRKVEALVRKDPDVFSLVRHAPGLVVFDCGFGNLGHVFANCPPLVELPPVELTPEQCWDVQDAIAAGDSLAIAAGASIEVECGHEHYTKDGVYFSCYLPGTTIQLESQVLDAVMLAKYAAGLVLGEPPGQED